MKRGYRVIVALRSLSRSAFEVFHRAGVSVRQAPVQARPRFGWRSGLAQFETDDLQGDAKELANRRVIAAPI